jgi:hypothetical protein
MSEHGFLYLVWQGNSGIGRGFTLLLLALGVAAGWIALWHTSRYRQREAGALRAVRGALARAQDKHREALDEALAKAEEAGEEPPPTEMPVIEPLELLRPEDKTTLVGDRLAEIARMKKARVRVQVEALQQMTVMRENARPGLAFPGYAVDLCTMGGMLGTFVGLCLMLLQMQGVLPGDGGTTAGGFAEASASLGGIIASKKTAFVTTLVGLFCAIVVSFLNFLLVRAQSAFYDQLERFTVSELLPATVPGVENERAMERVSLQLAESFATLTELSRRQEQSAELQKAMQEALGATVESIRGLALQAAHRAPEADSAAALAPVVQQMAEANAALVRTARSVAESARRPEPYGDGRPPRARGWGALVSELGGLAADTVGEMRRNPVLAVAGMGGAMVLATILW